ncbi:Lojap-related protein [Tripterygium wilfordii]|uniref:Lojap-related protein n=1 Tax=Tripterygium wilfordii TaxID=458696 RepID=A0A7J7D472_TRIWF|nr:Lojap-related protein [Tripterygium wilfordii]
MWAALRSRSLPFLSTSSKDSYPLIGRSWKLGFPGLNHNFTSSTVGSAGNTGFLDLEEVEKVLTDVKADNVQVIPVNKGCDWADFMVLATGRSAWHVKNIAQALIYQEN